MQCTVYVKIDGFSTTDINKYLGESFSAKFEVQQPQVSNDRERDWSWRKLATHPLQLQELQNQERCYQSYKNLNNPQHLMKFFCFLLFLCMTLKIRSSVDEWVCLYWSLSLSRENMPSLSLVLLPSLSTCGFSKLKSLENFEICDPLQLAKPHPLSFMICNCDLFLRILFSSYCWYWF